MKSSGIKIMAFSVLAVFLLSQMAACGGSEHERFIQGTWLAAGDQGQGKSWFTTWVFQNGTFKQSGYPPIEQSGKYRVLGEHDASLELELFEQKGTFGTAARRLEVVIDKEAESIKIDAIRLHRTKN